MHRCQDFFEFHKTGFCNWESNLIILKGDKPNKARRAIPLAGGLTGSIDATRRAGMREESNA
jgi:hypothetical protein